MYAIDIADVRAAAERLDGVAHRTPIVTCDTLNQLSGCTLFFKCEHLQKVGAFKFRGAYNAIAQIPPAVAGRGVVTHSSGNHAQAVALAARLRGIEATIVLPETASPLKRRAVESYGATIVACAPTLEARERTAAAIVAERGARFVHPYNDARVIAGQATVALELLAQVPGLDAIVAPVGGGGMISGICIAARALAPSVRVVAAEPAGADDAARSLAKGERLPQTAPQTIADGLVTSLGELTWPIIRDHVEAVLTVREDEIVAAMRLSWERAKLLIEPSAAVALAAVLTESFRSVHHGRRIGVVLSGGNVDLDHLPW